jgi:radical SAM superfamily enzyme YgiQ (UPF0313 family)
MRAALINTNRIKPPIAPIGLEYVAEALNAAGHRIEVLDLCWEEKWHKAIAEFLHTSEFDLVCLTLRNIDDSAFTTRQSFIGDFTDIVREVRQHTEGVIVVGGVGFSIMPEQILALCGADAGVWGDGEFVLPEIADRVAAKQDWHDLPNLVWSQDGKCRRNNPSSPPLADLPPMSRTWFDNRRYFNEGGQAGIETKRGCPSLCIYCADPIAKGKNTRLRPPKSVVDEIERLLRQNIDHIHTCDSEFNLPEQHAMEVSLEICRRNLGDKLRWYAYCSPVPFSAELARSMCNAGCKGINFGVDSGDEEMLKRLRREFTPADILNAAHLCKKAGIAVMFDLLLGSPGESRSSILKTIELMRQAEPDRVGISLGVRAYQGTELADMVTKGKMKKGLVGGGNLSEPLFFLEPGVASSAFDLLDELVGDDNRFLFFNPSSPDRNYNYNANQRLVDAIREGYRGAYWDILARYA